MSVRVLKSLNVQVCNCIWAKNYGKCILWFCVFDYEHRPPCEQTPAIIMHIKAWFTCIKVNESAESTWGLCLHFHVDTRVLRLWFSSYQMSILCIYFYAYFSVCFSMYAYACVWLYVQCFGALSCVMRPYMQWGCRWCTEAWGQSVCPWLTLSEPAALSPSLPLVAQKAQHNKCVCVCVCVCLLLWLREATQNAEWAVRKHVPIFATVCLCICLYLSKCVCTSFCVCVSEWGDGCPGEAADTLNRTDLPLQKSTKAFCLQLHFNLTHFVTIILPTDISSNSSWTLTHGEKGFGALELISWFSSSSVSWMEDLNSEGPQRSFYCQSAQYQSISGVIFLLKKINYWSIFIMKDCHVQSIVFWLGYRLYWWWIPAPKELFLIRVHCWNGRRIPV